MGKITFNIGQGGLGRALQGKDFYSAILFDSTQYPAGFSASEPIKLIASLQDAENLGILDDGTGETLATGGEITVTAVGASGDQWSIEIQSTNGEPIVLGEPIESSGETTDTMAAKIAAAINDTTLVHGFSATAALSVVSLTMAPNWGAAFNAAGLTASSSGAGTATVVQFSGGVGSPLSEMHYQISEFFRMQPKGLLWVGIYDESGGLDAQDITDILTEADGDIRQIAVNLATAYAAADLALIQTTIQTFQDEKQGLNALYASDMTAITITAVDDLRAYTYDRVSAILGMDGGGEGWRLLDVLGRSVPCIGAALGTVALAAVNQNIGWVGAFNVAGVDLDVLAFATGDLYKSVGSNTLTLLHNRGWVFVTKVTGKSGSFFDDSPTAEEIISDFAYIEFGRTMDKAVRGVNAYLADFINSPVFVDPDTGQLTELTIAQFKNAAELPLEQMTVDAELSGYQVLIDPAQNVLSTSVVEITVKLVPVGSAREIVVNIGFYPNIQT